MELLERVDYVIEELSKSTNERHAQERHATLTKLQVTKDIVQGSFRSSVPEPLKDGEERFYVTAKELPDFIVSLDSRRVYDTQDVTVMLGNDGRFCVTVNVKEVA